MIKFINTYIGLAIMQKKVKIFKITANGVEQKFGSTGEAQKALDILKAFNITASEITPETITVQL